MAPALSRFASSRTNTLPTLTPCFPTTKALQVKLHFLGANRQVTGSRYCLEIAGTTVMVDCGLFQERPYEDRNWDPCPIDPAQIDALLLTHVHIDHSGWIPRLVKEGFRGPIYATPPSVDMAAVMLEDSAKIHEEDAAFKAKRHRREGRQPRHSHEPLYTREDVSRTLPNLQSVDYNAPLKIGDAMSVTFHEAGHILGSAMLQIQAREGDRQRSLIFSGDIGQWDKPLIRDPTLFDSADYVIMESTYGDRDHREAGDVSDQLADVISSTVGRGGNVVIPTFAVERAQELIYYISELANQNRIPAIPVMLDSPMAVDITEIFQKHRNQFDEESWERIYRGDPPLRFPGLSLCRSVESSKGINKLNTPCVIMATSGMCTGGRIKHHLKHNIGDPKATILFVGHQGRGTLGQQIVSGKPDVRIHGREHRVRAAVRQIYGFSGHGDRGDLLRWISNIEQPRRVFLTHGDEDAALALAEHLQREHQLDVHVPHYGDTVVLD